LANHTYTGPAGSQFIYVFTVKNKCENTLTFSDTISITDDPLHKTFYYVENSATVEENIPLEDWSKRKDPSDHEILLTVSWPVWYEGLDTNFYVYFWYGGFEPDSDDPGSPQGFLHFTSHNINYGDTATAYIPLNPLAPPVIGMAAGWGCTGLVELGIEPDAWGIPTCEGSPVTSIGLIPGGHTTLTDIACDGIVINPDWSGICMSDLPFQRSYYEVNPNNFVQLGIWTDDMSYNLYGTGDMEGYNWMTDISWGDWQILEGNEITFTDWGDCAEMTGYYTYTRNGDTIEFTLMDDPCTLRANYLTKQKFIRKKDYGMTYDMSGCPGDDVLFKIAGGISYEWHFGDGYTSNQAYPKHAYSEAGIYNAFVVATNACGRTDTIRTTVTIRNNNLPYADFWTDKWDIPRYEPVQFLTGGEWMDQAGNYTYLWDFGDGTTSTAKSPFHAYERDGDYIVTLNVTNGCGTSTYEQNIWIQDAIATCNAKFDYKVSGDTVMLTDLSWGEPTSWFWDFGDGFTSTQQNPKHIYNRNGIYFICLSIFDESTDCASQICREVPVGTIGCRADFRFTVNEALNSVRFTDASTNAMEWFWDFGDNTYSAEQNPAHTYSGPGMYVVYLATYNNTTGCFAEVEKQVQVGADQTNVCFADFSFFVDEANKKVVLTDKSSSNITDWYWTFGDGTFISQRNPEHIYPKPGIYQVCLIVFDQYSGGTAEICKKIPVGVSTCNINADFAYFIDISTDAITFNDKSTGNITKWFWNFGDGTTSSKQNPKHVYTQPGYYLVTLSVSDATNACADHVAAFVQVGTVDCRAFFEYTIDAVNNKVTLTDKSKGDISDYFWFFGDGSSSVLKNPVHTFDYPGLYFIELTVVDASGLCMDYYFEPVQVGNFTCQAKFNYFIDSLSNVAYFNPDAIGDVTDYLWFFGDGSISTESDPVHMFTQPGYFTVGLNTFDVASGCMDYYEETILIGRQGIDCRANFMYMTNPDNLEVSFTNNSKGNITDYVWNFGDRQIGTNENPKHTYLKGGYYYVCLTVMNTFGITNTVCNMIQVSPNQEKDCLAKFIYTVDSATMGVRFTDKSFGKPDGWFWNFDDGGSATTQNPFHSYTQPGFYMVRLSTANSVTNCTSRTFKLVNVGMENQGLETDFSYDIDTNNLKADSYPVDFIGVSLGDGNKLKWTFGDGDVDTTSLQPTHEYTAPGTYTVCLTISNPVTKDSDTQCDTITVGPVSGMEDMYNRVTQLGNYPNPFRDITNIVYQLPVATDVDLSIFDNSGRKIETIVHEYKDAGKHVIEYNGAYLDSGVYHLRLVTSNRVLTSMMIVR
jgi:PKD repeat protein